MASFKDTFAKIEAAIGDLTSLEVTTYKGTITLASVLVGGKTEFAFDDVLKQISGGNASIRLIASTVSRLDGDTTAFLDENASAAEVTAHTQLLASANAKRTALIQVIEAAVSGAIKG